MGEGLCNQGEVFPISCFKWKNPGEDFKFKKETPGRVLLRGGFFQLLHWDFWVKCPMFWIKCYMWSKYWPSSFGWPKDGNFRLPIAARAEVYDNCESSCGLLGKSFHWVFLIPCLLRSAHLYQQ